MTKKSNESISGCTETLKTNTNRGKRRCDDERI